MSYSGFTAFVRAVCITGAILAVTVFQASVQAQSVDRLKLDPKALQRPLPITPELQLQITELPDLSIWRIGFVTNPDDRTQPFIVAIDLKNVGPRAIDLAFKHPDGRSAPTFDIYYLPPGGDLGGLFTDPGEDGGPRLLNREFLTGILRPGDRLRDLMWRDPGLSVQYRLELPVRADPDEVQSGVHQIMLVLDPEETLIERSKRNNYAAKSWFEDFPSIDEADPPDAPPKAPPRGLKKIPVFPGPKLGD